MYLNFCNNVFLLFSGKASNPIWQYYVMNEEKERAVCKICLKEITAKKYYGSGPLYSHLKQHPKVYISCMEQKKKWKASACFRHFNYFRARNPSMITPNTQLSL